MKHVFVDTVYWVGLLNARDQHHKAASSASSQIKKQGNVFLVTTELVLAEVLNEFSDRGEFWRNKVAEAVEKILNNPNVIVVPQTQLLFKKGLELYKSRLDKGYSLVDCISMEVMKEKGINEALTSDHHFSQEGFALLMS